MATAMRRWSATGDGNRQSVRAGWVRCPWGSFPARGHGTIQTGPMTIHPDRCRDQRRQFRAGRCSGHERAMPCRASTSGSSRVVAIRWSIGLRYQEHLAKPDHRRMAQLAKRGALAGQASAYPTSPTTRPRRARTSQHLWRAGRCGPGTGRPSKVAQQGEHHPQVRRQDVNFKSRI